MNRELIEKTITYNLGIIYEPNDFNKELGLRKPCKELNRLKHTIINFVIVPNTAKEEAEFYDELNIIILETVQFIQPYYIYRLIVEELDAEQYIKSQNIELEEVKKELIKNNIVLQITFDYEKR